MNIADHGKVSKHCVLKVLCCSAAFPHAYFSVASPSRSKMEGSLVELGTWGQSRGAVPSKTDVTL